MGWFNDLTTGIATVAQGFGSGLGSVASGVLNPVANIVSTTINGATGLINSPGGASALSSLGGLFGGPLGVGLSALGAGAQNAAKSGPGYTVPLSSTRKFFSFYHVDSNGLYERNADGSRRLNGLKIFGFVTVVVGGLVWTKKKGWW